METDFFVDLKPSKTDFFPDLSATPGEKKEPNFFEDTKQQPLVETTQSPPIQPKQPVVQEQYPTDAASRIKSILSNEPKGFWEKFGQDLALQSQIGGFSGAPALAPDQAKDVALEVGTIALVEGLYSPIIKKAQDAQRFSRTLTSLARISQAGTTGAAVPTVKSLVNEGELPSAEEVLKEGATWAAIDAGLQTLHLTADFTRAVSNISKDLNIPKREVIKRIWEAAKNKFVRPPTVAEDGTINLSPEDITIINEEAQGAVKQIEQKTSKGPEVKPPETNPEAPKSPEVPKPQLTPQQVQNRKIAQATIKAQEEKRRQEFKEQTESERDIAFNALGISNSKEAQTAVNEAIPYNPDAQDLDIMSEQTNDPDLEKRAQAYTEEGYKKDQVAQKLQKAWGKVDVEAPFKAVNAPDTGRAVKLFYDVKGAYLEEAKGIINSLEELKLTKEQRWDAFIAAETGTTPTDPRVAQAAKQIRRYYDQSFEKYKTSGGLTLPYPQSLINRLEQKIEELKTGLSIKNLRKQSKGRLEKEISKIRKQISHLKTLKYVNKPKFMITQALADSAASIDPVRVAKFAISAHRKRSSGGLSDWIGDEPRIKDVLDPYDFIRDYAQKKGRDLGLLRIIKSAQKEGLAIKGEKSGYTMNPIQFPALSGYTVHPALFEYMTNLANPIPFNTYDKITRFAKGTIVFDPTYFIGVMLPYLRTLVKNPLQLAKLPKYWKKALTDFLDKTPDYIGFLENGGASNPFVDTTDFKDFVEKSKLEKGSPVSILANNFLTKEGIKNLGNQVANFTWTIERLARMAYYNLLRDKGFSVPDAAKLSAENFIDYNKLPARTRRWLSRIFFAPAYQVLSMINDFKLLASPLKFGKDFASGKDNFKNNSLNKERIGLLAGTAIVLLGLNALYNHFGFKEEEFGTRYVADFEDSDGKEKELVITPSHPLNVSLRWANTFFRGFQSGETSPLEKLSGRLKGQLGPVPRFVIDIATNETSDGKKVWDPVGDSLPTVLSKVTLHALEKIEPFFVSKFRTPKEKQAAKQKIKDAFGWLYYTLDSIQFFYERKTSEERKESKIRYLKQELHKLEEEDDVDEATFDRYWNAIESIQDS